MDRVVEECFAIHGQEIKQFVQKGRHLRLIHTKHHTSNESINQSTKKAKKFKISPEQKVSEWRDTWMRGGGSTVVTWETGSSTTMITAAVHKWSSSAILSLVVLWLSTCSSGSSVYSTDIGNKIWCRDATFTSSPVIFLWDSPPRYWTRNSTCLATIYYASWVPVK